MVIAAMKLEDTCSWEERLWPNWQFIKKQRHCFANKVPSSRSYGFSSSHVWMWELDHREGSALKNWCFELWCWRRLLRAPWTARRSNQSILKEINPTYICKRHKELRSHILTRGYSKKCVTARGPCLMLLWKSISIVNKSVIFYFSTPAGLRQKSNDL